MGDQNSPRGAPEEQSRRPAGPAERPFTITRPFSAAQARQAGISRRQLTGRSFRRLVQGIYVSADIVPGAAVMARAALLATGDDRAVASHHTAALLWGGVVPHHHLVHTTVPAGGVRLRRDGVHVHAGDRDVRVLRGVPVTAPADTFLDLASVLGLVDLVVLGDSLVGRGVVTPAELVAAASSTRRGARTARRAAALVREGVDSAMESRSRMLILLAGLPEPVVNYTIYDDAGRVWLRLDLSYPELRLAVEYDGRQHAESTRQWERDVGRREELDGLGWRLVVLLAKDIYRTPEATLARICAALGGRGRRVAVCRDEWRRHFPGRG